MNQPLSPILKVLHHHRHQRHYIVHTQANTAVCNIEPRRLLALPRECRPTPRLPQPGTRVQPPLDVPCLTWRRRGGNLLYIALHLPLRLVSATCTVPLLLRHTRSTTRPHRIVDSFAVACYMDYYSTSYTCSRTPLGEVTGLLLPADDLTRVYMSCFRCWRLCWYFQPAVRDKNSNVIWRIDERVSRPSNEPGSEKGLTLGYHMQDRIMCYHLLPLSKLETATLVSGTGHFHRNIHTLRTLLCHSFKEGLTYAVPHGASL